MIVRLADNYDKDMWDEFVLSCPDASPYHLYAWKMAIQEAFNHRAYYLIAEEHNRITGILPLIYLNPPLFSGELVSLPFCDVGGALAGNEKTKEKLILEAVVLAQKIKANYIELRGRADPASFEHLSLSVNRQLHKVRMLLELPESSGILWSNFKSKLRNQIHKAEKNGLTFKWGTMNDLSDFYSVFSRNMRDLGSPVHSKEWFYTLLQYYGERIRMGLVYHNEQLIGVGIILSINKTVSVPWASTLRDYNRLSPNMLLYWNFLRYASDNGFGIFDFGRSSKDSGTYRFKEQWGAHPVNLYWYDINVCGGKRKTVAEGSSKRDIAADLWSKMPLPLANFLGPRIRKYISL